MDGRPDQHLKLTQRNALGVEFFFDLEHRAPLEGFRSLEPSFVIGGGGRRVGQELGKARNIGLAALHIVFLRSRLLLDGGETVLGFLHQAAADRVGVGLEFRLQLGDRGCQSGFLDLLVLQNLANEGTKDVVAKLRVLSVVEVLFAVLALLKHLDTGIKFDRRYLVAVHFHNRIALRRLGDAVHGQKADCDTCRENDDDPFSFFINPR